MICPCKINIINGTGSVISNGLPTEIKNGAKAKAQLEGFYKTASFLALMFQDYSLL